MLIKELFWLDFGRKRAKAGSLNPWNASLDDDVYPTRSGRALASDEVIGRPRAAHHNFDPRQVPGRHLVAVLVFLYFLVVDQMGDVNQHAAGIDLAAADILVERRENLVDLD